MKFSTLCYAIIFFLVGCKNKAPKCAVTREEFIEKNSGRIFETNRIGNRPDEFRDKGKDSIIGGYYSFYQNGNLKSYDFLVDIKTAVYKEQFDSAGNLMYTYGNPLLFKQADLTGDSLTLRFFFLAMQKEYSEINLTIGKNDKKKLLLSSDTLFSNVKSATYVLRNLSKEMDIDALINAEYKNKCTGQIIRFTDSVSMHYTPK